MPRIATLMIFMLIIIIGLRGTSTIGFSLECSNGFCQVSAAASPISVFSSFVLAGFLVFYPQKEGQPFPSEPVKIWERIAAFFVDILASASVFAPLFAVPVLMAEANATGAFNWSFYRDFARPSDYYLGVPLVLTMMLGVFGYFYAHAAFGRRTLGQYLLGFRIEPVLISDDQPRYALNVFLGYIGFCVWPVTIFLAAKRPDKLFWWNIISRIRTLRVL